jgi:phosphoribosylformylglycinamidine cyclo-ligase
MISYKDSGVDIDIGDDLVNLIKPLCKKTKIPGVLSGIGGFAALFEVSKEYKEPVLVSSTDGVGTKLKLASEWNIHDTIGIDLVAMSVNDILTVGAKPLFFLDYFSTSKLNLDITTLVIKGISEGCLYTGCALIGGETAEMPDMYQPNEYDLAGFAVGVVEKSKMLPKYIDITAGDIILGLSSSGFHSNGYSLIRKCINLDPSVVTDKFKRVILSPTKIYVKQVLHAIDNCNIKALAHITGSGLLGNIPRVLPSHLDFNLNYTSWNKSDIFAWVQTVSGISDIDMQKTFNCGIGMIMIVDKNEVQLCKSLFSEEVFEIGEIISK